MARFDAAMSKATPGPDLQPAHRAARRLLRPLVAAVTEVAGVVQRAQARLQPRDIRAKGEGDYVTTVDVRGERLLRRALLRALPEAGFLGEETPASELGRDWLWVVDPIDGTSNFAHGLPHFAVSAALLFRGRPLLACVHCAPEGALYTALDGGGARRDGRRIRVRERTLDAGAIVGCQWHRGQQDLAFLARLQKRGNRIRTFGSTVTQLADVAMGRLDANVQEQGRVWDYAAAGLVAVEAGARFTDWRGRDVFPLANLAIGHTATIAAPPGLHAQVVRLLRPFAGRLSLVVPSA